MCPEIDVLSSVSGTAGGGGGGAGETPPNEPSVRYRPGLMMLPNKSPSGLLGGRVPHVGGGIVGFSGAFGSGGRICPRIEETVGSGGVELLRELKSLKRMRPPPESLL